MNKLNNISIDKNFLLSEFECPCCKRVMIHSDLLKLLVKLRLTINRPIYINSGYRCKEENDRIGGVLKSYHIFGMAADITVRDMLMSDLALHAKYVGFTGIGLYPTFLHLDIRPIQNCWEG